MDVVEIIDELDDHGFEDTDTTRKLSVINDTVADTCSREPWPFLEDDAVLSFVASTAAPVLPSDFRAALTIVVPSLGRVLQPERLDTIVKSNSASLDTVGVPYYYYFVGEEMRVLPVPATAYTGTLFYLRNHPELAAVDLESSILIPPRHHRLIVLGSLARLYAMEDDPDLALIFEKQYETRLRTMEQDVWKKQFDRPDRIVDLWSDWGE